MREKIKTWGCREGGRERSRNTEIVYELLFIYEQKKNGKKTSGGKESN